MMGVRAFMARIDRGAEFALKAKDLRACASRGYLDFIRPMRRAKSGYTGSFSGSLHCCGVTVKLLSASEILPYIIVAGTTTYGSRQKITSCYDRLQVSVMSLALP